MNIHLFLTSVLIVIAVNSKECTDLENIFEDNEIIPDIIDSICNSIVHATYEDNVTLSKPGVELTPTQVRHQPQLKWTIEPDTLYTLVLSDPDVPSRADPQLREFNHWLVGNINGDDVDNGETIHAYIGSGPENGTGFHRYTFLVYKQPGNIQFDMPFASNTSTKTRKNFSTRNFARKFSLGTPVAGNFYQAQYDDYVPIIHNSFTD